MPSLSNPIPDNAPLRVAAVALNVVWGDVWANLMAAEEELEKLEAGTDVVVFPELFTTGFIADEAVMADAAEGLDGETMTAVRRWAQKHNALIAGSFLYSPSKGEYLNRGFMVQPDGAVAYYDKHHLFSLSLESRVFTPGEELPPVVAFHGWNVSMVICYDLRFPVWCRNVDHRYDLMLIPANWPQSRGYAWQHLLIARTIENQAPIVGANRSGTDNFGCYDGLEFIFDALGQPPASLHTSGLISYAELNLADVHRYRRHLPVGPDADPFTIHIYGSK